MLVQEYPEVEMSFTGHVLRGSSGEVTLQILEEKLEKLDAATAQGRR